MVISLRMSMIVTGLDIVELFPLYEQGWISKTYFPFFEFGWNMAGYYGII